MGEVLRPQSEEPPKFKIHRFHREFVSQIEVLVAEFREVTLVKGRLLVIVWHRLQFQQSRLSHEDGLNLEEVVAVMSHGTERNAPGPLLKHIAVDAKTVVTGKGHEVSILPRAAT